MIKNKEIQLTQSRRDLTDKEKSKIILNIIDKILISQILYLLVPTFLLFFFNNPLFKTTLLIRIALPVFAGTTLTSLITLVFVYKDDYIRNNWFKTISFYLLLLIWTSNLLIIGIPLDRLVFNFPISGFLTLTFLASFILAYPLSKWAFGSLNDTKSLYNTPIFMGAVLIHVIFVILGVILIYQSALGLKIPWFGSSWATTCALGIFMIVFSVLLVGILVANNKIYRKLKVPEGINIWNRTDNHNIFICLRNLLLGVFVIWIVIILILVLIFLSDGGDLDLDGLSFGSSSKKKKKADKKNLGN
ncbi:MAG: hypothetical protein EU549_01085 [Promethearchaeota archaeon]|nr:MAG: hypothetical protein EU549_01085 [Candidatus Lokiarchaeota archaeon]